MFEEETRSAGEREKEEGGGTEEDDLLLAAEELAYKELEAKFITQLQLTSEELPDHMKQLSLEEE